MFKKRITAFIIVLTMLVATFTFTSCSEVKDGTEGNAYVSVYVYNAAGKKIINERAVKVSPNAEHAQEWGKKLTPYLALETVCSKDNKNKVCQITTDLTGGVSIDKIDKYAAGENESGDKFNWVMYVNGNEVDENYELKTYDLVEVKYVEDTYRMIEVTVKAQNGAVVVLEDTSLTAIGEKDELTVVNVLNYKDSTTGKINSKEIGLTLSEDGKSVAKIGDVAANDTHHWVLYMDEVAIEEISEEVLKNGDTLNFVYEEIEKEESGEETTEAAE